MSDLQTLPAGRLRDALTAAVGPDGVGVGDSERDLHATDLTFHRPHRPDLVVYPDHDRGGVAGPRARGRAPRSRDAVRGRHEPRGSRDPRERGDQPRSLPPHRHPRHLAGQPDGHCLGGGDPARARAGRRGARPLLPRRPGSRRNPRRHGRHECSRHDHGALREDARQRARARGRPRQTDGSSAPARRHARHPPATTSPGSSSARKGPWP